MIKAADQFQAVIRLSLVQSKGGIEVTYRLFVCFRVIPSGGVGSCRRLLASAAPAASYEKPFHPNEPSGPSVKTSVPGPKSLQLLKELSAIQVNVQHHSSACRVRRQVAANRPVTCCDSFLVIIIESDLFSWSLSTIDVTWSSDVAADIELC